MASVLFFVALCLILHRIQCQSADTFCASGFTQLSYSSYLNGKYIALEDMVDGKKAYQRTREPDDGCLDLYLVWDADSSRWKFAWLTVSGFSFAWCYDADLASCNGKWIAYNNKDAFVAESRVTADSCPQWDCDYISIPDATDPRCRHFDVKYEEVENVWTNGTYYWYFSPGYMAWVCSEEYVSPDVCNLGESRGAITWTTNESWVDIRKGESKTFGGNHAPLSVLCGSNSASQTNSSGSAEYAVAIVIVVLLSICLCVVCYRSLRFQQKEKERKRREYMETEHAKTQLSAVAVRKPQLAMVVPVTPMRPVQSISLSTDLDDVPPKIAPPRKPVPAVPAHSIDVYVADDAAPAEPEGVKVTSGQATRRHQKTTTIERVCLAAENDEEVIGDDAVVSAGGPRMKSMSPSTKMASLSDQALNVRAWLETDVGMPEYFRHLVSNGYDSMGNIMLIENEHDLEAIGIVKKGHQKRLLQEIERLGDEGH